MAAYDRLAIEWKAGHGPGFCPGADEDVLSFVSCLVPILVRDFDIIRGGQSSNPADVIDLVLLEEELDASTQFVGDFAAAADDLAPVEAQAFHLQTELLGAMGDGVIELRIFQQSLGRNAAPVETRSTSAIHFDAGHFFAELSGANGTNVSGWSATNNNEVVGHEIRFSGVWKVCVGSGSTDAACVSAVGRGKQGVGSTACIMMGAQWCIDGRWQGAEISVTFGGLASDRVCDGAGQFAAVIGIR